MLLKKQQADKLIIVYNADEGWVSAVMDAVHKVVRPETYECSLCMVSYGPVSMRNAWRKYLDDLPMEKNFYHRQDFARAYPARNHSITKGLKLPVILSETDGELNILLGSNQLDQINNVDALIAATDLALANR